MPEGVPDTLRSILRGRGVEQLYSHQMDAFGHVMAGKNVVLATPTATGKTLAYNLPILTQLLNDAEATALYLFPTKALSQDQRAELENLVLKGALPIQVCTCDGDTPASRRRLARDRGRIVITNPDMLHVGILPHHPRWARFFQRLRFVVIDELHIYRGVFGSHVANVIRRLKRISSFYQSRPRFFCCSATIGNPLELAGQIIEEDAILIDSNGAPAGERHFLLYNPPLLDPVNATRRSVVKEAHELATRLLRRQVKTIVFTRSRNHTELISGYIRNSLGGDRSRGDLGDVASYRSGYLPKQRRQIEDGLREGVLRGVVSTNALELGVDIGGLDASIMTGFPGTISSCWQQAGRSGRGTEAALSILIASPAPLDQFIVHHPEYLFGNSPESGRVDPNNLHILLNHIKCSIFEIPYRDDAEETPHVSDLLRHLEELRVVHHSQQRWFWLLSDYPAKQFSLRNSGPENVIISENTHGKNRVIGEMDRMSAKILLYDGAIYLHGGHQYYVQNLNIEQGICTVVTSSARYFTESIVRTDIKVLHWDKDIRSPDGLELGDILVRTQVTSFKKISFNSHEVVGRGEINLPADEIQTRVVVIVLNSDAWAGPALIALSQPQRSSLINRLGHLLRNVAPVFLLCDVQDFGVVERIHDPELHAPSLYLYDTNPGGSGLAEGFCEHAERILNGCLDLVTNCSCHQGCPSCIGPLEGGGNYNPKDLTIDFLKEWIAPKNTGRLVCEQNKVEGVGL